MFHYLCPRCGNVSDEGFSIIGGPECAKCGTEMVESVGCGPAPDRPERRRRPVARRRLTQCVALVCIIAVTLPGCDADLQGVLYLGAGGVYLLSEMGVFDVESNPLTEEEVRERESKRKAAAQRSYVRTSRFRSKEEYLQKHRPRRLAAMKRRRKLGTLLVLGGLGALAGSANTEDPDLTMALGGGAIVGGAVLARSYSRSVRRAGGGVQPFIGPAGAGLVYRF